MGEPWHPLTTIDTTNEDYWLNWRVLVSGIWVLSGIVISSYLIWKYEVCDRKEKDEGSQGGRRREETLYDDESWRPCLKGIHPAWLMAFRVISFSILLALLIVDIIVEGRRILYYYTHWTLMLETIYFGLGSLLSIYGCLQIFLNKFSAKGDEFKISAMEESNSHERIAPKSAGFWGYLFQIIYQINVGAVMLTDCIFWFVIFPFLAIKSYHLNLTLIGVHSVNAIFLLGDTALNSLRFPWFRIAYFLLWTSVYVIFQWVIHATIPLWWPYPFLDLSSPRAPLWYLAVGLMQIPCYALFYFTIGLKSFLLARWYPHSYSYYNVS